MVYKNDVSKLRLAVRNYLVRMIGICSFAIAFNIILFFIVLPAVRPEMRDIQPVLSVAFLFVAVYCQGKPPATAGGLKKFYSCGNV